MSEHGTLNFGKHSSMTKIDDALKCIRSGQTIVTSMAAAEPTQFLSNLHRIAPKVEGLTLFCANPLASYEFLFDDKLAGHLNVNAMFLTDVIRQHASPSVHYVPQHLSQWSRN